MTPADVATAIQWARAEGWNPGLNDAACFGAVDPNGFLGGYLAGELIASISVVNYDGAFAFVGCFIVAEQHRGKGHGYALWRAGLHHAGTRLAGLDGVPVQVARYERSGFELAYRNVRYSGRLALTPGPLEGADRIVAVNELPGGVLAAYDRTCFPAQRDEFLAAWSTANGHRALAVVAGERLVGYGVLRPCHVGFKVGPLFADDAGIARSLLAALAYGTGAGPVFLDVPEVNRVATALAEDVGMTPVFETARMYTGPPPDLSLDRVFGVSSFELG